MILDSPNRDAERGFINICCGSLGPPLGRRVGRRLSGHFGSRDKAGWSPHHLETGSSFVTTPHTTVLTAGFISIDRFLQNRAPIFCLCFDGIGARHPGMTHHTPNRFSKSVAGGRCGSRLEQCPCSTSIHGRSNGSQNLRQRPDQLFGSQF